MTQEEKYGNKYRTNRRILLRDNPACHWCGKPATEADHLIERDLGGSDEIENLVPSCKPCNSRRGAEYVNRKNINRMRTRDNAIMGATNIPPRPCIQCGKDFIPDWRNVKRGQGKHCSRECVHPSKNTYRYTLEWNCQVCGIPCTETCERQSHQAQEPTCPNTCADKTCKQQFNAINARNRYRAAQSADIRASKYPELKPHNAIVTTEVVNETANKPAEPFFVYEAVPDRKSVV